MFTSGFFNSINSDRKYNAEQMAAIFDGLITDGVFDSIGDHFQVTPASSGLGVNIGTGRAWLNQTWSYNDTAYPVTLGAASPSLGRKDLICLKVDKSNAVRANSLVVIAGTPAASPVETTVTDDTTNGIYYHKLAVVTIPAGATSISTANITNYIGLSTGTPYVTGLLSSTTVDELWSQWDGEFNDWWDDIKATLDDNIVTTLLNKIDHITPKEATMNLYGFSHINPPPSGMEYKEYSTDAILNQISTLLNGINGVNMRWHSHQIREALSTEHRVLSFGFKALFIYMKARFADQYGTSVGTEGGFFWIVYDYAHGFGRGLNYDSSSIYEFNDRQMLFQGYYGIARESYNVLLNSNCESVTIYSDSQPTGYTVNRTMYAMGII